MDTIMMTLIIVTVVCAVFCVLGALANLLERWW